MNSRQVDATTQLICREDTVKEKKRQFRERVKEMMIRKGAREVINQLMCTPDTGLVCVREGATTLGMLDYSNAIQKFREKRIAKHNERFKPYTSSLNGGV